MDQLNIIEHIQHSVNYTLFDAKWVPSSARCVLLGQHPRGTGALDIFMMSKGKLNSIKSITKPNGFKCGTFNASPLEERNLATGCFDGSLFVWDLERLELPTYHVKGHSEIINCIDGCGGLRGSGAPEIATGSRDGSVKIWDTRQPDDPVVDISPDEGQTKRDCWAVAFVVNKNEGNAVNEERCIAAGYDNGDIKLFDLRAMRVQWESTLPNGVCSLEFDRQDISMNKLLATCLESRIHVFDLRTFHPADGFATVSEKTNHKSTVWIGKHSPHDRDIFMTCGGSGGLSLWKYSYPKSRSMKDDDGVLKGVPGTLTNVNNTIISTQPINSFDWHRDMRGLCLASSFDQTVRVCLVTNLNLV